MQLWDALTARDSRGSLYAWTGDRFEQSAWSEVLTDAEGMAATLRRAGVRPGTQVAVILTNSPLTVRGLLAVWLAGGAVASLPVPTRGMSLEEYGRQLQTLISRLNAPVMLVDDVLLPLVPAELRGRLQIRSWESLPGSGRIEPSPPGEDDLAFIQYSSGSTSVPKGCRLTPRAIARQLEIILDMSGGRPGAETIASWLPLSHDMGVFGCLLYAWAFGSNLVLSTPERFMFSPGTWFRDMSSFGATMTAGTSTALHLATRSRRLGSLPRELLLRVCVIGAERVDWDTLQLAAQTFETDGLRPNVFMPAYGLAEATLAVTACPWDEEPRSLTIDALRLADGDIVDTDPADPAATRVVSTGPACRGVEVSVADPDALSEIMISSPSLSTGYFAEPDRTRERFVDGGLRTGDLGFLRDGELHVVGRSDDLISVGGRNVYTREIEAAIDGLGAVRRGCSAVIDMSSRGRNELVLFVELRRKIDNYPGWAAEAAEVAMRKAGVALSECLFLERGTLPKTPSGKIQRFRCRNLLLEDRFEPVARVVLS